MTRGRRATPMWFAIVVMVLAVWGAVGVFACVQQIRLGAEAMGPADAYYRRLYASFPIWYNGVYALATGSGLAAAIALVLRSALAQPLFLVSLVAVVVQFGWLFTATGASAFSTVTVRRRTARCFSSGETNLSSSMRTSLPEGVTHSSVRRRIPWRMSSTRS